MASLSDKPSAGVKRSLRKIGLIVTLALITGTILLVIVGVPSPPAITTKNVGRIPWKWAWRLGSTVRELSTITQFQAWVPFGHQMIISTGTDGKIHRLQAPEVSPEPLEGVPDRTSYILFPRDSSQRFLVYSLDEGGSELYRLYRYDQNTRTTTTLTQEPARSYLCCFDPQGERIAYSSTRRNGEDFDLYLMNPADPTTEELMYQADGNFFPFSWSSDGRYLAVTQTLSHTFERLYLFDVENRVMQRLLSEWGDSVSFTSPRWSADGQSLFFASDYGTEFEHLRRYDLTTGHTTLLSESIPWDVMDLDLTPDGTRVVFRVNENGLPALYLLNLSDTILDRVKGAPPGYLGGPWQSIYMHPWRNEIAINVKSASGLSGIYSYHADTERWTRWTQFEQSETILPEVELIQYPTFDSVQGAPRLIPAFLFPADSIYSGPRPVIINIHGGPAMQASPTLNPMFHLLRQYGVSIIAPNVRGSSGYGKDYQSLDDHRLREDAVRDIGALLDWIARQADLDADRVALMGGSYGGYMVLASLTHYSDRLRCGCDMFGISHFTTYLKASQEHHLADAQRAEFGDERNPAMHAFLDSISPLNHADRITVPLLIFQGTNDMRVKPEESRQMVARIQEQGGTVHYIEAADEGHGITQPLNLLYFGAVGMDLLEDCLLKADENK